MSWKRQTDGSYYLPATREGFVSHSIIKERVWARGKLVMRYALYAHKEGKWQLLAHYRTLKEAKKSGEPVGSAPWLRNPRRKCSNPMRSYRGHRFYATAGTYRLHDGPTFNRINDLRDYIDWMEDGRYA